MDSLIYSEKFGEKSFNLDVADRNRVYAWSPCSRPAATTQPDDASESVYTLVARYDELDDLFPGKKCGRRRCRIFIDWLQDRVQLVQITAYADDDAYAIFETMNDRGLKLTPADMLKSYLLANVDEGDRRTKANNLWRKRIAPA